MDDSDLRRYTEELSRAHMAWAKAAPNGSEEQIRQACEELSEARRALAKKKDRLDHLLGHPWRVGLPGSCDCNAKPRAGSADVPPGTCEPSAAV